MIVAHSLGRDVLRSRASNGKEEDDDTGIVGYQDSRIDEIEPSRKPTPSRHFKKYWSIHSLGDAHTVESHNAL